MLGMARLLLVVLGLRLRLPRIYSDAQPGFYSRASGVGHLRDMEARECKLVKLGEPRVESSLRQPACTTAVGLVFVAIVEAMVPV